MSRQSYIRGFMSKMAQAGASILDPEIRRVLKRNGGKRFSFTMSAPSNDNARFSTTSNRNGDIDTAPFARYLNQRLDAGRKFRRATFNVGADGRFTVSEN